MNHSNNGFEKESQTKHKKGRQGDGFGEFPNQMSTPHITNLRGSKNDKDEPQSRIRFADGTKLASSNVLVLGPKMDTAPLSATSPLRANSLDFSMIATPGGAKLHRFPDHESMTPSEAMTTTSTSSAVRAMETPFSKLLRGVVSYTPNVNPRKLLSATPYTAARESLHKNAAPILDDDDETDSQYTALAFARSAPLSGYLRKLGNKIPTFKRRFFVLKPTTHLYYFLSPADVEPRGCIDLDLVNDNGENGGCQVREIGVFPDGTFRFELVFQEEEETHMKDERLNIYRSETGVQKSFESKGGEHRKQSIVLEARTEDIGREWISKLQSERLSTARDEIDLVKTALTEMEAKCLRWERAVEAEEKRADEAEKQRDFASSAVKSWEGKFHDLNEAMGLLVKYYDSNNKEEATDDAIDCASLSESKNLKISDTHFSSVCKAFESIHNNYMISCNEAEKAKKRAGELEKLVEESKASVSKAEAKLCEIWEDNYSIQKELKRARREKKILVREVRALRAIVSDRTDLLPPKDNSCASTEPSLSQKPVGSHCDDSESCSYSRQKHRINSEERRLVIELEEHVMSGLRLSEQFLTLNGIEPSEVGDDLDSCIQTSHTSPERNPIKQTPAYTTEPSKLCSLLDDESTMPNDEEDSTIDAYRSNEESEKNVAQFCSAKTDGELVLSHHDQNASGNENFSRLSTHHIAESMQAPDDPHLFYRDVLKGTRVSQNLNDRFSETCNPSQNIRRHQEVQTDEFIPNHIPTSQVVDSNSGYSKSKADAGHPTIKLECPLKTIGDEHVYHITFYSGKIGLQFQKIPVETTSHGVLADALTADYGPNNGVNQNASDLRRIASISQYSSDRHLHKSPAMECPTVLPVDMVLVCGFVGFDDSTGNTRPSLGARLVAFDGIPVEVGKWTFESIRKSIQARGRPLTLSFRNDVLTPKQHALLVKAVNDVRAKEAPVRTQHVIFRSTQPAGKDHHSTISKTSSVSSNSNKYYSLSEAGSSISSAVVPLVSNLITGLSGVKQRHEDSTPDYLRRQTDSKEVMKHHHDFQSGLL